MANHLRRQIRERCASTLSGLSTTGTKVFQSRIYPMESAGLPGLCIYTQNEDVSIDAMGATRTVGRDLELIVNGYVTGSNLDDTLDRIWKEVEGAYSGDIKVRTFIRNNIAFDRVELLSFSFSSFTSYLRCLPTHTYAFLFRNSSTFF